MLVEPTSRGDVHSEVVGDRGPAAVPEAVEAVARVVDRITGFEDIDGPGYGQSQLARLHRQILARAARVRTEDACLDPWSDGRPHELELDPGERRREDPPLPAGTLDGHSLVFLTEKDDAVVARSEEHTSELQSRQYLVCRLLLEKKKHFATWSF